MIKSESYCRIGHVDVPSDQPKFMTTQWTQVLAARGQSPAAKESLKILCERYYAPVVAFVERYTQKDQQAQDWTHSFFAKLLEGHALDSVLPSQGKFRSYLLGAVKHFLADQRAKQLAAKRGGSSTHRHIEATEELSSPDNFTDVADLDAYFDKQWALSILHISLQDLETELDALQRTRFELLRPWLSGDPTELSLADAAARLGMSAATIKVTIHRWRKRFREIVKSHIASTLSEADDINEELSYLIRVLAS